MATVFGLLMPIAEVVTPDEIFHLGDFFLLLLIGAALHLQSLAFQSLVLREIAGIRLDCALMQLQRAIGHAGEEIAVVADDEDRLIRLDEESLEPLRCVDLQLV